MRRIVPCAYFAVALAVIFAGCGPDASRITGRVLDNGQPVAVPGSGAPQSVVFESVSADGATATGRMYSAALGADGTFELVAAGGSVPPGSYRVSFDVTLPGNDGEKFKRFRGPGSPLRRELKPGSNDLTIDLAKPEG
ncbi:carboxypeptidase-like regulatory domain-containing protein [Gemmata sp.]|uniref:carboxypeptidase-like regulatory domain-containing protein n=1 Tax=Gemmata sp. TaxID=1914242 RepID=UPI003F70161A